MFDRAMPGTVRLLRISVFLPALSILFLGLTRVWREGAFFDSQVIALVLFALLPVMVIFLPWAEEALNTWHLATALAVYLVCQTLLTSLLQNLGLVRFDMVPVGPIYVVEPGVLLMVPLLLIAWQYGWRAALLASATAGTLHLVTGMALHWLAPDMAHLSAQMPMLRPDLLYFLPLLVAYLGGLLRTQERRERMLQSQLRNYAARAEVVATGRERHRLAEQLQQTVGRSLLALSEQLSALATSMRSTPDAAARQLAGLCQMVDAEREKTQQVIDDLQAFPQEDMALVEAIRQRLDCAARRGRIHIAYQVEGEPEGLTAEQEMVLYHTVDQVLSHIEEHPDIQHIDLRLSCMAHLVALTVHGDGAGCPCQHRLRHMETSAQLVGGRLCVSNDGQHGTTVALWLPLNQDTL